MSNVAHGVTKGGDDVDVLEEKWNNILTRAVNWKVKLLDESNRDDEYHKFGYYDSDYGEVVYPEHRKTTTIEAVCTEDTKSLFFERRARFLKYGSSEQGGDGSAMTMIYKPDSSEKTLYFNWDFDWIAPKERSLSECKEFHYEAFPRYKVKMEFYTEYSECKYYDSGALHGGVAGAIRNSEDYVHLPCIEDLRFFVGDKFYNTLISFSKKLDSIKEEQEVKKAQFDEDGELFRKFYMASVIEIEDENRKLEEAKKNRIKDEFDSI